VEVATRGIEVLPASATSDDDAIAPVGGQPAHQAIGQSIGQRPCVLG
jgi:hypothetical protein